MVVQLFMSHTQKDKAFCDKFDSAAARVGIKVFRSEYETIKSPPWKTIKEGMHSSSALFLLVGKELVNSQKLSDSDPKMREEWKYTQNWMAYETGLACERGIDIWVLCDNIEINFPVPYLNNYDFTGSFDFIRNTLNSYRNRKKFPLGMALYGRKNISCRCAYKTCGSEFNLHTAVQKGISFNCPTCLKPLYFQEGWLGNSEIPEKILKPTKISDVF